MMPSPQDQYWMQEALKLAQYAQTQNEVPVGAVLVLDDQLIASGWNQPIATHDATAHAEIIVIRAAAKKITNYRLLNTTLYVTIEPCLMCAGAIIHARIKRVVFGATDAKGGAMGSVINVNELSVLNHKVICTHGVLKDECVKILQEFFKARRKINL